ncbi:MULTISPECIES: hypothetical protein [Marinovum]|uniref:hypothetical protein n=1 Tax=Marinovum TaxID=367771 RepID=UPI00237AFD1B|nr:hypothetical protein [Marinovum sp. PR37]MDD9744762.1 hypothetical protein [Marinovum sp. PR37]
MSDNDENEDDYAFLSEWRQGDFSLNVGGFLYAEASTDGELYDAREIREGVLGLVVISQTCDIVRRTGGRHYVAVCPLIKLEPQEIKEVHKGRKPYLSVVENVEDGVFADLRRPFSVDKDLLRGWARLDGFSSEASRARFSSALERKFGQFAFPDEFDSAFKNFKDRVWSRHDKTDSPPGKVYRSIHQIRFRVLPNWESPEKTLAVIAILLPAADREVDVQVISAELSEQLAKVKLPDGYRWDEPPFVAQTADSLTATDILQSHRGDFDFLCF